MFGIFKSLEERKRKIDQELLEYKNRKYAEFDTVKRGLRKEVADLAMSCARDIGNYEHTYHSKMEELGIKIAKQEARLETVKNDEEIYKRLIEEKNAEIERITKIATTLAEKQTVTIEQ